MGCCQDWQLHTSQLCPWHDYLGQYSLCQASMRQEEKRDPPEEVYEGTRAPSDLHVVNRASVTSNRLWAQTCSLRDSLPSCDLCEKLHSNTQRVDSWAEEDDMLCGQFRLSFSVQWHSGKEEEREKELLLLQLPLHKTQCIYWKPSCQIFSELISDLLMWGKFMKQLSMDKQSVIKW